MESTGDGAASDYVAGDSSAGLSDEVRFLVSATPSRRLRLGIVVWSDLRALVESAGGRFEPLNEPLNERVETLFDLSGRNLGEQTQCAIVYLASTEVAQKLVLPMLKSGFGRATIDLLRRTDVQEHVYGGEFPRAVNLLELACSYSTSAVCLEILGNPRVPAEWVAGFDRFGRSMLMLGCQGPAGATSDVALAILRHPAFEPASVNAVDSEGWTALMLACRADLNDVAMEILGSPVLTRECVAATCEDGLTALMCVRRGAGVTEVAREIQTRLKTDS